jgi:RNA polymerase sigma-70 factor, ECF subfamily
MTAVETLEAYRGELTGYCYRMLGAAAEAEDAVQETFVRAWRAEYDPARAPVRAWLYTIATNVCLDLLRGARRRAVAMDLGPAATPGPDLGPPLPPDAWVRPLPDALLGDPAEVAAQRDTIRLAFVVALQRLPPRQRAVLILREVLAFSAAEVAGLLGTTVASANSALQRARATIRRPVPAEPLTGEHRELLARYVDAFERHDVAALTALLHEDATMSMPPFPWWLRGRAGIAAAFAHADFCEGARLVPTSVNGSPAFGQYGSDGAPFALVTVDVRRSGITSLTTHLDLAGDFPRYGLPSGPMSFAGPRRRNGYE